MYQEYTPWLAFQNAIVDLPIRVKGNLKQTSGNSLSPSDRRARNKDIDPASQRLLTEVKLRTYVMQAIRWCVSGVSYV